MGLLGDGWDDPQSLATLQLAGGLLSPGSFGQGLQRGIAGYQGALENAQQLQIRKQAMDMQAAQLALLQRKQSLIDDAFASFGQPQQSQEFTAGQQALATNKGAGLPAGPLGAGYGAQPSQMPAASQPAGAAGPSLDTVTKLKLAGVADILPEWKARREGVERKPGSFYEDANSGQLTYIPDVKTGLNYDPRTRQTFVNPGFLDATAAITGATKAAETRAVNQNTPIPLERLDRMPSVNPLATVDDLIQAGRLPQLSTLPPAQRVNVVRDSGGQGTFNGQPFSVGPQAGGQPAFKTAADLAAEKVAAEKNAAQPIDFSTKVMNDAHTANQAAVTRLADVVNNESEIVGRNERLEPFLAQLPNVGGFGYDQRAEFANKLKNSGLAKQATLDAWAAKIAGGDADAVKTVQNQLSAAAIQTMLDTLNKEGTPNRNMFAALHEQQEGLAAGKPVLENIMALQKKLRDQHVDQLGAMTDLMSDKAYNPVKFQYQFATHKAKSMEQPATDATPAANDLRALAAAELARRKNGAR